MSNLTYCQIESSLDAIYMAILHGHVRSARSAFYLILDNLVEETYEEVVNLAITAGAFVLAEEIDRLKGNNNRVIINFLLRFLGLHIGMEFSIDINRDIERAESVFYQRPDFLPAQTTHTGGQFG